MGMSVSVSISEGEASSTTIASEIGSRRPAADLGVVFRSSLDAISDDRQSCQSDVMEFLSGFIRYSDELTRDGSGPCIASPLMELRKIVALYEQWDGHCNFDECVRVEVHVLKPVEESDPDKHKPFRSCEPPTDTA